VRASRNFEARRQAIKFAHGPPSLFVQMLTVLAEKLPASAGYRGSDLVLWRTGMIPAA
jgi:hypothetical protein